MKNKIEEPVVLDTDDSAAQKKSVEVWVSRTGRIFTDERAARFDGSTHSKCECGNIARKNYTKCDTCIAKGKIERYNSYKFEEWDFVKPVYSDYADKYFFSVDDIASYCEYEEIDSKELRLLICEPNEWQQIGGDYWDDLMPENSDGDLPKNLESKLKELNDVIANLPPISYSPSKVRTEYLGYLNIKDTTEYKTAEKIVKRAQEHTDKAFRLKQARKMKGLSLREAAFGLTAAGFNLSHQGLKKYEDGEIKIDSKKLIAFANFYGVTTDYLVPKEKKEVVLTNIKFHKNRGY